MKLTFSPPAQADFRDISDFAVSHGQVYHDRLMSEIEDACRKLTKFPDAWPFYDISGRKLKVRYIGRYAIYYQVIDKTVIIEMIIHSARDVASALEGRELFEETSPSQD